MTMESTRTHTHARRDLDRGCGLVGWFARPMSTFHTAGTIGQQIDRHGDNKTRTKPVRDRGWRDDDTTRTNDRVSQWMCSCAPMHRCRRPRSIRSIESCWRGGPACLPNAGDRPGGLKAAACRVRASQRDQSIDRVAELGVRSNTRSRFQFLVLRSYSWRWTWKGRKLARKRCGRCWLLTNAARSGNLAANKCEQPNPNPPLRRRQSSPTDRLTGISWPCVRACGVERVVSCSWSRAHISSSRVDLQGSALDDRELVPYSTTFSINGLLLCAASALLDVIINAYTPSSRSN